MLNSHDLPIITLTGDARERGIQYGKAATSRIHRTRDAYAEIYAHYATWDWDRARAEAEKFVAPITSFHATSIDEMIGMAEGSGLDFLDVVAINLRTEILFAAKAKAADAQLPAVLECTSFGARTAAGEQLVGQTWDWLTFSTETIVLLEAFPANGPAWMTVVEAGLLAKMGMNSSGLTIATNALVSSADRGSPGVPYHVMLRALLDCRGMTEAATLLQSADRASSANYLMANHEGLSVDAESQPGGFAAIAWAMPNDDGLLLHANHFTVEGRAGDQPDVGRKLMADSLFRLQRIRRLACESIGGDVHQWKRILSDHAGHPNGICCHPDPNSPAIDQWKTVTGVIFEPGRRRAHISPTNPCEGTWVTRDYAAGWA